MDILLSFLFSVCKFYTANLTEIANLDSDWLK